MRSRDNIKKRNRIKKEAEDYFKAWFRKSFQKGVKDARALLGVDVVAIVGIEFLTFVEQSILDDEYSKQVVTYTRKKAVEKNFAILKTNMELILGQKIDQYYIDFSVENNTTCMTLLLGEEVQNDEKSKTL